MPHPLSIQRAMMMDVDELLNPHIPPNRSVPYQRRVGRARHSSNHLFLKICTNAAHRKNRDRNRSFPPPSTSFRSSPPPSFASTSSQLCLPPTPPTFARLGPTQAVLPLEVINMIVTRHLEDDISTLKSFSLSCRYFCVQTRPMIFRRVRLYMHPALRKRRGCELLELFTSSRHLLPYIKHAMILNLFPDDSYTASSREDKDALRVLMNLSALAKISIHGYNNWSWNSVPRDVQLAIKTSLRGKGITAVEVVAMSEFPVYLLEGCRSLKELTLAASPTCYPITDQDGVAKKTMTFAVGQHDAAPIYLETLSLTMPTPQLAELTEWILSEQCSLDISRVKSMHIRHRQQYAFYEHQMAVSSLLRKCSTTLQELELDAYTPSHTVDISAPCPGAVSLGNPEPDPRPAPCHTVEDVYKLVDLGQLKSLRRVSLSFGLHDFYDEHLHVSLLSQMFRNVGKTHANKLEDIGIFLWITKPCRNSSDQALRQRLLKSGSWATLDRTLSLVNSAENVRPASALAETNAIGGLVTRGQYDLPNSRHGSNESSTTPRTTLKNLNIQLTRIRSQEEAAHLMAICLPILTEQGVVKVQDKLNWIRD